MALSFAVCIMVLPRQVELVGRPPDAAVSRKAVESAKSLGRWNAHGASKR
jgi:hypothetical protein